jgi:hypothetical protein
MTDLLKRLEVPHPDNEDPPTALISHDVKPIEKKRRVWGELTHSARPTFEQH